MTNPFERAAQFADRTLRVNRMLHHVQTTTDRAELDKALALLDKRGDIPIVRAAILQRLEELE